MLDVTEEYRDDVRSLLCTCNHSIQDLDVQTKEHTHFDSIPLRPNGHTTFSLLHCRKCHKILGMPPENLELFIQKGFLNHLNHVKECIISGHN